MSALCRAATIVALLPSLAVSQDSLRPRLEFGLGWSSGIGGEYRYRSGPFIHAGLGFWPRAEARRGVFFALRASLLSAPLPAGDDCQYGPSGQCLTTFPMGHLVSAVVGVSGQMA